MRMIKPPGRIESGAIRLDGDRARAAFRNEMRNVRLAEMALVPQGAMNSLNPVMRGSATRSCDGMRTPSATDNRDACAGGQTPGAAGDGRSLAGRPAALPARVERRHEAARVHRHRDLAAAEGDHRRRADQRARRRRPAPDHADAEPRPAATGRSHPAGRPRHGADGASSSTALASCTAASWWRSARPRHFHRPQCTRTRSCSSRACRRSTKRLVCAEFRARRHRCSVRHLVVCFIRAARKSWRAARSQLPQASYMRPESVRWLAMLYEEPLSA